MNYTIRCYTKEKGYHTRKVKGTPIDLMQGYEFFVHKSEIGYAVSEVETGYQVAQAFSKEWAIHRAKEILDFNGSYVKTAINKTKLANQKLFAKQQ
jgi:hypothetical protein